MATPNRSVPALHRGHAGHVHRHLGINKRRSTPASWWSTMAKIRSSHVQRVWNAAPEVGRAVLGCGDWNTLVEEVAAPRDVRRRFVACDGASPHRRCRHARRPAAPHAASATRSGARRRHRPRFGHAARRRARHRQEHAAPPAARRGGRADALRERRGERPAGAPAAPSGSAPCSRPVAARRDRRCPTSSPRIDEVRPALVVVDSIQTVADPALGHRRAASPRSGRAPTGSCTRPSARDVPVVLVGHVTKDGGLAGPRVLEHVVDTVLSFEGDRHHALRLLRATKHRFGPTDELGLFEMAGAGLVGVPDPSDVVPRRPARRRARVGGRSDDRGAAADVVEVQALTAAAPYRASRRGAPHKASTAAGWRCCWPCSQQRAACPLGDADVYASTVGGVRLAEPGLDLAVCLAVVSALERRPLPPTSQCSARSGSVASCARSPTPHAGSPRRPASVPTRDRARATHRRATTSRSSAPARSPRRSARRPAP